MYCPSCKKDLKKAIFYGVEVDYCPNCLGIFFEEEELRWAKDEKDKNLNWVDIDLWEDLKKLSISREQRLCPSCRLPLYEVNYNDSKIIVDICNVCRGIWLDRGEFKKIIKYLKQKANYEVFENYNKNLLMGFWEIFAGPESWKEEFSDFLAILKIINYKFATQHPAITKIIAILPK